MAVVDQKERYRQQAALCYEIAAELVGERAISMMRLGDTYAALAVDPHRLLPNIFTSRKKYVDPTCPKCGQKMHLTHSLPRTGIMPAMQAYIHCVRNLLLRQSMASPHHAKGFQ